MVEYQRTLGLESDHDVYRDEQQKATFFDGLRGVQLELKNRLVTIQGEQPFAPDFGLDVFAVAGAPKSIVKREVRRALRPDDRVQSVDDIVIEQNNNQTRHATVTVNLTLVDGEGLQLNEVSI